MGFCLELDCKNYAFLISHRIWIRVEERGGNTPYLGMVQFPVLVRFIFIFNSLEYCWGWFIAIESSNYQSYCHLSFLWRKIVFVSYYVFSNEKLSFTWVITYFQNHICYPVRSLCIQLQEKSFIYFFEKNKYRIKGEEKKAI